MKKLPLLIAIAFLLQSCYGYKQIDANPNELTIGKKYKIVQGGQSFKVTIEGIKDSTAIVSGIRKVKEIPLKNITKIKERRFSTIKTIALFPTIAAGITLAFMASNPNLGGDH